MRGFWAQAADQVSLTPAPRSKSFFLHFLQYAVRESVVQILQRLGQQNSVARSQLHGKSTVRKWTEASRTNSPRDRLARSPAGEGCCPDLRQRKPRC